jgi:hypothetical protein
MEHQCLHLIIAPLLQPPKCELTPHEHSMYIRFLCSKAITAKAKSVAWPMVFLQDFPTNMTLWVSFKLKVTRLVTCANNFGQIGLRFTIWTTVKIYDNEITSLIDIYFLRISFIPSDPFRYFIYVTYSNDK